MELANSQEETNDENILFVMYKKQLIGLGFRHKEAKILLKYIIKYYDNILIHKLIIFADIYYFYEYFFEYEPRDPFSILVCKILNKWVHNNTHTEYNYLYGRLHAFGEYIPWARMFVDLESIFITKILSLYYHKKQNEQDDILIMKEIIYNNLVMFTNEDHANIFFNQIAEFFRTSINWKIFIKNNNNLDYNSNYYLPQELMDNIYTYLNI